VSVVVEQLDADTAVVRVGRDALGEAADALYGEIGALLAGGTSRIVVEFDGAGLLNSKLLDALVRASAGQDPRRGGIALVAGENYIRQMLEISETGGIVLLVESREDALEALPSA
jgi:hypothetical protein